MFPFIQVNLDYRQREGVGTVNRPRDTVPMILNAWMLRMVEEMFKRLARDNYYNGFMIFGFREIKFQRHLSTLTIYQSVISTIK